MKAVGIMDSRIEKPLHRSLCPPNGRIGSWASRSVLGVRSWLHKRDRSGRIEESLLHRRNLCASAKFVDLNYEFSGENDPVPISHARSDRLTEVLWRAQHFAAAVR